MFLHRRMLIPFLDLIVIFGLFSSIYSEAVAQGLQIEDVIAGIKELEKTITSVSVDCNIHGITHDLNHPDIPVRLRKKESIISEKAGRARCEGDSQDFSIGNDGKATLYPLKTAATFDGNACRSVRGRAQLSIGLISSNRSELYWTIDPLQMSTHYYSNLVSQILEEKNGQIVGQAVHDGHEVLVLQTEPVLKAQSWGYRFLVAPEMNFAVVKRSQLIQFPPHEKQYEFTYIAGFDYFEPMPGVWLPKRVVNESHDPTEENARTGTPPRLSWKWEIQNQNWIVNPDVSDSLFTLEFPPGAEVEDKLNGTIYKVAGISEGMLTGQARLAQEWKGSGVKWALLSVGFAIIVLLVILIFIRQRKVKIRRG